MGFVAELKVKLDKSDFYGNHSTPNISIFEYTIQVITDDIEKNELERI